MIEHLLEALEQALEFRKIDPNSITRIDSTVGFIWFKADENTYLLDFRKVQIDLDEYLKE